MEIDDVLGPEKQKANPKQRDGEEGQKCDRREDGEEAPLHLRTLAGGPVFSRCRDWNILPTALGASIWARSQVVAARGAQAGGYSPAFQPSPAESEQR